MKKLLRTTIIIVLIAFTFQGIYLYYEARTTDTIFYVDPLLKRTLLYTLPFIALYALIELSERVLLWLRLQDAKRRRARYLEEVEKKK